MNALEKAHLLISGTKSHSVFFFSLLKKNKLSAAAASFVFRGDLIRAVYVENRSLREAGINSTIAIHVGETSNKLNAIKL